MSQQWWEDDDQLLAALRESLGTDVPAGFIATAKAVFAWRDIDAELATLTYDSVFEDAGSAGVRAEYEPASLRCLTFTSSEFTVEIEVTEGALLGQLVPPGPGRVEARTADGNAVTAVIDQVGGFTLRPVPRGPFRLYCRTADDASVLTDWIMLEAPPGN